jgi:hypothetical protein
MKTTTTTTLKKNLNREESDKMCHSQYTLCR